MPSVLKLELNWRKIIGTYNTNITSIKGRTNIIDNNNNNCKLILKTDTKDKFQKKKRTKKMLKRSKCWRTHKKYQNMDSCNRTNKSRKVNKKIWWEVWYLPGTTIPGMDRKEIQILHCYSIITLICTDHRNIPSYGMDLLSDLKASNFIKKR